MATWIDALLLFNNTRQHGHQPSVITSNSLPVVDLKDFTDLNQPNTFRKSKKGVIIFFHDSLDRCVINTKRLCSWKVWLQSFYCKILNRISWSGIENVSGNTVIRHFNGDWHRAVDLMSSAQRQRILDVQLAGGRMGLKYSSLI